MPGYYRIAADDAEPWPRPPSEVFCSRDQADSALRRFLGTLKKAPEYRTAANPRILGPFDSKAEAEQTQ